MRVRSLILNSYFFLSQSDVSLSDEILHAVLPDDLLANAEYVSKFETAGHVGMLSHPSASTPSSHAAAHLNLHSMHAECLPWKHIIAQVILDVRILACSDDQSPQPVSQKNNRIRTVVNKTDTINDSLYRIFPMEILAGESTTLVTHVCFPVEVSRPALS